MPRPAVLDQVFKRSDEMVFRRIADEALLVPLRSRTADLSSIFQLNEVATRIWELLDGQRTGAQVAAALVAEFEVTPEVAADDVATFLARLLAAGAVTASD